MDWITDRIAIGNIEDALNQQQLVEEGITGILCLNGFPRFTVHLGVFDCRVVTLNDGPGNSPELLDEALTTLRDLLVAHNRILVHCAEGVSRSPFTVACYLAQENGQDVATTLQFVAERRTVTAIQSELFLLWEDYQRLELENAP